MPLAPVLGRSELKRDTVWQRARAAGLAGAAPAAPAGGSAARNPVVAAYDALLTNEMERRIADANDPARLDTALNWLERYAAAHPGRPFLLPRGGESDMAHAVWNDESFARLETFIRMHGSVQPGKRGNTITSDTISGYLGAIRTTATILSRVQVASEDTRVLHRPLSKQMRLEEPRAKADARKIRLGLRHAMLADLAPRTYFDRSSSHGHRRWTGYLVGISLLLRGGEFGVVLKGRGFVRSRGLHWGSRCVAFRTAAQTGYDRPSVNISVCPVKDQSGRAKRHDLGIASLHPCGYSLDPLCAYSHLCREAQRVAHLSDAQREHVPIFAWDDGTPWATEDVNGMVREAVEALGLDPSEYGGASPRIGGATDLRDRFGMAGKDIIQKRGRWLDDDIGFIYQRVTAAEMLDASVSMVHAARPEQERLTKRAQPARALR